MATVEEWNQIRKLHFEEGVAKKELARRFGRDIKTIRRLLERQDPPGTNRPAARGRRLDAYRKRISELLRTSNGKISARSLREQLMPETGPISERTVRQYLADFREELMTENGTENRTTEVPDEPAAAEDHVHEELVALSEEPIPEYAEVVEAAVEQAAPSPLPIPETVLTAGKLVQTPPHPGAMPTPGPDGTCDPDAPEALLNRELTWLSFNYRVLHEAEDARTPLLDRLKFVGIVGSNLDEFFMKRIGGLKQQVGAGVLDRSVDGRTPQEQIDECIRVVRDLQVRLRRCAVEVHDLLRDAGIVVNSWDELGDEEREALRAYYFENIYPLVTPQATDPAHPFPFISNLSINLLVGLRHPKDQNTSLARVKVPVGVGIPRFLQVPGRGAWIRMEAVMEHTLDMLFPGMVIENVSIFRVTRNANTEQNEENAEDLLVMIESELRERKFAPVVRLEVSPNMPSQYRGMLAAEMRLDEEADVFEVEGMIGKRDVMELALLERPELQDAAHHPVDHPLLATKRNIFHTIREEGPILLQHPFQSFPTSVERFIREASLDPKVRAIKMTLYRTSASSKSIPHLIEAARNGKQVAVVVELKARFDEAANIRWASRMEEVGIHVTYGVVGLKTHCKVILVVRQDYSGLRRYAHIGTGNYHAGTARLYSDIGMLTCDPGLGADLTELLNYLTTGYRPKRQYDKILVAPKMLKQALLEKIEREIHLHATDSLGLIRIKCNALEDAEIARALYVASQAGVRVELIVRDTCRVRPGIPGLSENIRVVGIVGRFLEHARLYYFRNGGQSEHYIGSADAMKRNLESRVEFLAPVEDPTLKARLDAFMELQLADRRGAWEMQPDGSYIQLQPRTPEEEAASQTAMIEAASRELKKATRLRRRKPRGLARRNVRG